MTPSEIKDKYPESYAALIKEERERIASLLPLMKADAEATTKKILGGGDFTPTERRQIALKYVGVSAEEVNTPKMYSYTDTDIQTNFIHVYNPDNKEQK